MAVRPRSAIDLKIGTAAERGALDPSATWGDDPSGVIGEILDAARTFVDAEVAYVGEFRDQTQVFRWISGDSDSFGLRLGGSLPLSQSYCRELITGRLPGIIPDTHADAIAQVLDITGRARIGAYVGAPIMMRDGTLFGTLAGVRHEAHLGLDDRHARFMSFLARLVGDHVTRLRDEAGPRIATSHRIREAIDVAGSIRIVFQPIVELGTGRPIGEEALARFDDGRSTQRWFADAWESGLGKDFELAAIRNALPLGVRMPPDVFLALNVSPETLMTTRMAEACRDFDPHRLVLEVTEHRFVDDYGALNRALAPFRERGVRLAVDDAGAGFSTLNHILALAPDFIKLDVSLTRGIEHDPARQALASSLMAFAARIGASLIAEGIETQRQIEALQILGIRYGQGYLLGSPKAAARVAS